MIYTRAILKEPLSDGASRTKFSGQRGRRIHTRQGGSWRDLARFPCASSARERVATTKGLLREKSPKGCVSNFYSPTGRLFHSFLPGEGEKTVSLAPRALTLYRADSWIGELSAPISDAAGVCLPAETECARAPSLYVRVRKLAYAYVCHEGSGTSGSLGGRRISVIDGTATSLGGDTTDDIKGRHGRNYARRDAYEAKSGRVRSDRRDTRNYARV